MIKIFKITFAFVLTGFVLSCSQVLQTVELDINTEDRSVQEIFNVVEKTLTIREAKAQKTSPYSRAVLKNGRGENAQPIPEKLALKSEFPKKTSPLEYKIGIGDTLTYLRLIENIQHFSDNDKKWPPQPSPAKYKLGIGDTLALVLVKIEVSSNQMAPMQNNNNNQNLIIQTPQEKDITIESTGRVGSDGSILLLEVGRLEASGKTLNELRSEVRNILIRNGLSPRFQMEINEFKSQKIYLTINSSSKVIFLDDQIMSIRDILTSANVGFQPDTITHIKLQRNGEEYLISLRDIYSENAPELNVRSGDHIFVQDHFTRIVATSSIVDHRGNVVFEGVGEIKVAGRSLDDLRNEITVSYTHLTLPTILLV